MSAPIKPKSGGVNLFLTRGEVDFLKRIIRMSPQFTSVKRGERARDLLTVIQSQSKESSNDS